MPNKRFNRSRGRLGSKRLTSWASIDFTQTVVSGNGNILNSLGASGLAKRPFTIVRTHLEVEMGSDQLIATESQLAAIGMCVVSDEAVAIGVSAVPTPVTSSFSELWFIHQVMFNTFDFISSVGFGSTFKSWSIDSKAMRKVEEGQDAIVVAQLSAALSDGVLITAGGRMLIKEH